MTSRFRDERDTARPICWFSNNDRTCNLLLRSGFPKLGVHEYPLAICRFSRAPTKFESSTFSQETKVFSTFERSVFEWKPPTKKKGLVCYIVSTRYPYHLSTSCNVLFENSKCTLRGTCTPTWEPLV